MKLIDFLNKETPTYGGCMLCFATYYNDGEKTKYLLIERVKSASGDMFIKTYTKTYWKNYDKL